MTERHKQPGLLGLFFLAVFGLLVAVQSPAQAAPYAALVMDARNGEVLHARNADTRLHPASLTKMMTLYIVFEAVEHGELSMDDMITISRHAASEPPSKLGLRAGQKIALRYLVRAAAVKSANDAASAIAEAVSGSEAAFARRMNRTARAIGMTRTTFKNAHGLTEAGHLSTARDMTILGRHVLYDYPQYYNLFSRRTADAGMTTVSHTNRRLLASYRGADGIKTGYTRAAGFNLVASAERGNERVIATVFGGRSTATRNERVAELLDMGFNRAPSQKKLRRPGRPAYQGGGRDGGSEPQRAPEPVIVAGSQSPTNTRGKSIRVVAAAVTQSLRPTARPGSATTAATQPVIAALSETINATLAEVKEAVDAATPEAPETVVVAALEPPAPVAPAQSTIQTPLRASTQAPKISPKPAPRPEGLVLASASAAAAPKPEALQQAEIVTRISTSGGRHWGVNVGRYGSRYEAERVLLKTALAEMSTLDGSLRKVVSRSAGHDANFMGLTREQADLACRRLQARNVTCFMIGPS